MTKAPKHQDEEFDSNKHREADKAKIEKENRQNEMVAKEEAENQEIATFKGFPVAGETRDQLLDRIRKMRDDAVKMKEPVETEGYRSEGMLKEFNAEQEAGRAAVAKAAAEAEKYRAIHQQEAEGEKK